MNPPATLDLTALAPYTADLYHCSSCNYCVDAVWPERGLVHVCATLEHHGPAPGYSGRGYIEAARALLEGETLDLARLAERVYTCTTCGNCQTSCPLALRPAAVGLALREVLHTAGHAPDTARATAARLARGRARTAAVGSAPAAVSLFAGCAPAAASAALALLSAAGVDCAMSTVGACCGARLAELGERRTAADWAQDCATAGGVWLVTDYGCLAHLHAQGVTGARALFDWLDEAVADGRLALELAPDAPRPLRVRLLEACRLKPRAGAAAGADETRLRARLEALGVEIANAGFPSPYALCCGAAGGMPDMQAAAARRMAAARVDASDCPHLVLDSRCAAHYRASGLAVLGLTDFLARYCVLTPGGHRA